MQVISITVKLEVCLVEDGGVTLLSRDHWTSLVSPLLQPQTTHLLSSLMTSQPSRASVRAYLSWLWVC